MIIVSQDKDNIINFDSIVSIGMEDLSDSNAWQRITAETIGTIGTAVVLGDYKTVERAKEVLSELINFYEVSKRYEFSYSMNIFWEEKFVYKMPEE